MARTPFNDGWSVRPKSSIFADLQGGGVEAQPVTLPHDALLSLERSAERGQGGYSAYTPGGAFEYSRSLEVPQEFRTKRVSLEFDGVYRDAMVYVNGDFAGQRPYGYSGFAVQLDPFLKYGETNSVRVDARVHQDSRWYTGAGIHRDVRLVVTELVHIAARGVQITTPDIDEDRAVVEVATTVVNSGLLTVTARVVVALSDEDGAAVATGSVPVTLLPGTSGVVRQRLLVRGPRLWSIDHPHLHSASIKLSQASAQLDEQSVVFGIRKLQLDAERGLRINGEVVKLRGACIHHDNGILGAAAIGRADERRIEILKAAGFNAIRSSHNPLSPSMLDACDRVGMLVMDETFDMWAESKSAFDYSLAFPEWWERDVEAMVANDFNHPSVIFYSIGNEIPETGSRGGAVLSRRLAEKVRSLDSTRFVTNGINGFVSALSDVVAMMRRGGADGRGQGGVNAVMGSAGDFMNRVSASPLVTEKTEESFAVLDAAGINYGDSRYTLDRELFPDRVIIGTETFPTRIDSNWKLVMALPHVLGDFTWTGWDYLGEVGIGRTMYLEPGEKPAFEAPFPWLTAWCGDIDITGHRRPASYYRETVFGLRHEPYIAVLRPDKHGVTPFPGQWAWTDSISSWSWQAPPGSPVTVEVYSDAPEVELRLDGRVVGRAPAGPDAGYRAVFETTYEPGELTAVGYAAGRETGSTTLRSALEEVQLVMRADRTQLRSDASDLAFLSVEIRDGAGTLATHRDRAVTVVTEGAGVLQGLGSARPDQAERFDAGTHTTFEGRLLAIIRPTGCGEIIVTATCEGLDPVTVRLVASSPA